MTTDGASRRARLLVVEDDPGTARALRAALEAVGHAVTTAPTAAEALEAAAANVPEAVILDLLLPDAGGIEVCRRLREWATMPIIVLSGVDSEEDKVAALEAGADDYVTKPFSLGELQARIRVALRRTPRQHPEEARACFGTVEVDLARRRVTRSGQVVKLTAREYDLLRALVGRPGRVWTHNALAREAWGVVGVSADRLRFHIASLRRKLEEDPTCPIHLVTETGVGYRLLSEPW